MMRIFRETMRSIRASPIVAFYALVALGLAGYNGLMVGQMSLGLDFYLPGAFGQMQHGAVQDHRVHDITFGLLYTTLIVGVLAQLRRPANNVAGMVMALIPFAGVLLAAILAGELNIVQRNPLYLVAAVTAVTALLHPSGRAFFRSFNIARVNLTMVALVTVAAVPLLGFASTNIRLQRTVLDGHTGMGHYAFMAGFSYTVIGVGLLASLRPDGWRLTAWVAGALPAALGVSSVLYPDVSSSLGTGWALAAIGWGAVFVATAELTDRAERSARLGSRDVLAQSAPSEGLLAR